MDLLSFMEYLLQKANSDEKLKTLFTETCEKIRIGKGKFVTNSVIKN